MKKHKKFDKKLIKDNKKYYIYGLRKKGKALFSEELITKNKNKIKNKIIFS